VLINTAVPKHQQGEGDHVYAFKKGAICGLYNNLAALTAIFLFQLSNSVE